MDFIFLNLPVPGHSVEAVLSVLDELSEDGKLTHEECDHLLTCLSELFFLKSGKTEEDRDAAEVNLPEGLLSGMENFKVTYC